MCKNTAKTWRKSLSTTLLSLFFCTLLIIIYKWAWNFQLIFSNIYQDHLRQYTLRLQLSWIRHHWREKTYTFECSLTCCNDTGIMYWTRVIDKSARHNILEMFPCRVHPPRLYYLTKVVSVRNWLFHSVNLENLPGRDDRQLFPILLCKFNVP